MARSWLHVTTADRVIAALHATASKNPPVSNPAAYTKSLIDDPTFPQAGRGRGKPPPVPERPRPEDQIYRAPRETRT